MLIDQLPEANTLETTDEIPVERDTSTMKARLSTLISKLANTFVQKAGDTMTGRLDFEIPETASGDFVTIRTRDNKYDLTTPGASAPAANVYNRFRFSDAQNSSVADISHRCTQTNRSDLIFRVSNYKDDGERAETTLLLGINKNGNPTVQISDPDAWLSALKAGEYYTATASTIVDAESGCEITQLQYQEWGKVAQLRITVKKTGAVSSGNTTLATLKTGRRPKMNSPAQVSWGNGSLGGLVGASGAIQVNGAITAGQSISLMAVYILA